MHGLKIVYKVDKRGQLLLVIPGSKGLRDMLLEELHSSSYAAHLGVRKTVALLKQRMFWPKLEVLVKKIVRGCAVCQRTKDVNNKK